MRNLIIGIMGCLVNCSNLGCVALTYSLLSDLNIIAEKEGVEFQYVVFDERPSQEAIDRMANKLCIDKKRIRLGTSGALQTYNLKGFLRAYSKMLIPNIQMRADIRNCDVIIDMTGGDSFSDIYGKERFYKFTSAKKESERLGVPLILGPQTYGPFMDTKVKSYAKKVIERARLVMARDNESVEYLNSFCNKEVIAVTDLAFSLPFSTVHLNASEKIKIGINPSGLLGKAKNEQTVLDNKLMTDYDLYLSKLVDQLNADGRYELHFISHVGNEAIDCFPGFDSVKYHEAFNDPIEAKSFISTMDVFIGSRMHATIGAFSAGVATIPVAYSKKFLGLFSALGYDSIVDLQKLSTEDAVQLTIEYVTDYKHLEGNTITSKAIIEKKYQQLIDSLATVLGEL